MWCQIRQMFLFRASTEYNMCLFFVVGSDRRLKNTPQGQCEAINLILGSNLTHRVVQGHGQVQHVPLLCGGKWEKAQDHTTGSIWGVKLNFWLNQTHTVVQDRRQIKHVPLLCGGKWEEAQNHTTGSIWGAELNFGIKSDPQSCSELWESTTCTSSLWWEVRGGSSWDDNLNLGYRYYQTTRWHSLGHSM